ncbi:type III secretion protein HrpB4 [Burkholderia sp. WAC0059]|uniref:type III secretion protein HrpB4 n=1 Tax=Burkholderia sp. WAC0059 TaxID=2066022 RepID=UPI0015E0A5E5|nr:type III secretion protein HrpB4 [Burkholderia sp. WAC0059]
MNAPERAIQVHAGAARVAAALVQYQANRRALFDWLHPDWFDAAPSLRALSGMPPGRAADCAEALLAVLGQPPAPLDTFDDVALELATLPMAGMLWVLRLRVLWERRAELRRWIDRSRREQLAAWIGPSAANVLRGLPQEALGAPTGMQALPELGTMSAEALAFSGYCLFERDRAWPAHGPLALARLALPADAAVPAWIAAGGPPAARNESTALLAQLPNLLVEPSW